jgi:transcriptional regulator with XRE-family HTH domain
MNIALSEQLKKLRREKGNTQEELAEHLGITM